MRSFPGADRPRRGTALLAVTLAVGVLALPPTPSSLAETGSGGPGARDRAEQVQGQVADASADLDEASRRVARTARVLERARASLAEARTTQRSVGARLQRAEGRSDRLTRAVARWERRLDRARTDLDEGRAAVEGQHQAIAASVRETYTRGDPQLLAIGSLMAATSVEDLTRQVAAEEAMVGKQTRVFDDLTSAERALARHRREVRTAADEVRDRRQEATRTVRKVSRLYVEARSARRAVASLVSDGRAARRAAVRAQAADRAELARLEEREARIRGEIRDATAGDRGGYTGPGAGFLDYPAQAPVTSPYGYRVHPIYGYRSLHDGTDFGVACGTPLVASADGRVLDRYTDEIYGKRLYVSVGNVNGSNLTLVYNHLSAYAVGVGDRVGRGETVAYGGSTGWSTGCHLHFTVLLDGVAVDPMRYL